MYSKVSAIKRVTMYCKICISELKYPIRFKALLHFVAVRYLDIPTARPYELNVTEGRV